MVATHPEILVRHHTDPGLIWTLVASAVLHLAGIGLLFFLPQRLFRLPPGAVSYTVELSAAREVGGTNLVPGKGERGQHASTAPKPAAPEAKPAGEPASANSTAPEKVNKPEPPVKLAEKAPEPQPKEPKPALPKEPPPKAAAPAEQKPAPPPPAAEKKPAEPPKGPQPEALKKTAPEVEKKPQPAPKPQAEVAKQAQPEPKKPPAAAHTGAAPAQKPAPAARAAAEPTPPSAARAATDKEREARALDQQIAAAVQRRTLDQQIAAAVRSRAETAGRQSASPRVSGAGGQSGGPISYGPGQGAGGVVAGAEFIAYYNEMMNRVKASWVWPGSNQSLEAVVSFGVTATGEIVNVRTVRPSGDRTYDLSVERAVRGANPLSPPPEQYRELFVNGVEITFRPEDLRS